MNKTRTRSSKNEDDSQIRNLHHIRPVTSVTKTEELTVSPSLAMAGSRYGGASRWPSMPSKTIMNFFPPSSIFCSITASTLTFSHLPSMFLHAPDCPSTFTASLHAMTVRSNRCRTVIHSRERMIAWETERPRKTASVVKLFPVASRPCRTKTGKLGTPGCVWH